MNKRRTLGRWTTSASSPVSKNPAGLRSGASASEETQVEPESLAPVTKAGLRKNGPKKKPRIVTLVEDYVHKRIKTAKESL